MYYLERYVIAQEEYYGTALEEIRNGKKESHWMWFVFPQIQGLGHSDISKCYAIQNREEAEEYLAHPVLGKRLMEICVALLDLETSDPVEIFGEVDAGKLQSSMTLFWVASGSDVFVDVLFKYFGGNVDLNTIQILRGEDVWQN